MSERSTLSLIAIVCWLAAAFFAINNLVRQAAMADWWLPLLLLVAGAVLGAWAWMRPRPAVIPPVEEKQTPAVTPPVVTEAVVTPPPAAKEVVVADAVELPKAPDTTEVMPAAEDNLGLSAEEMAIQKPSTPQTTTSFDEGQLGEAVRRAEATYAEKEKDETHPTRPDRRTLLAADPGGDETQPSRPEKPMTPTGLSAEEMAIQKPTTPHATERFDDAEMDVALARAKERAEAENDEKADDSAKPVEPSQSQTSHTGADSPEVGAAVASEGKRSDVVSAEQMAAEKPITTEITRKISRDMLPPTSTREMASKKPPTEISTHELEGTVETEAVNDVPAESAVPEEAAQMAEEKPATPLATMAEAIDPGALPIDTPLIDVPPPSTQMMEVETTPQEPTRHISTEDTIQIPTIEVAAEGVLNNDDLTKIEGIGPKIAAALISAGISTFSRLATTPEEELREILDKANLHQPTPTLPTWWEQAVLAARGDWDALKEYQDNLGSEPNKD